MALSPDGTLLGLERMAASSFEANDAQFRIVRREPASGLWTAFGRWPGLAEGAAHPQGMLPFGFRARLGFSSAAQGWAWLGGQYLFITEDGGQTWQASFGGVQGLLAEAVANNERTHDLQMLDARNGFLAMGYRLFSTADGGRSWSLVTRWDVPGGPAAGGALPSSRGQPRGIHFLNRNQGYLLWDGVDLHDDRLYVTQDGGRTWQERPLAANVQRAMVQMHFSSTSTGWLVSADGLLLHTRDGGSSWGFQAQSSAGGAKPAAQALTGYGTDQAYLTGSEGSLWFTSSGGGPAVDEIPALPPAPVPPPEPPPAPTPAPPPLPAPVAACEQGQLQAGWCRVDADRDTGDLAHRGGWAFSGSEAFTYRVGGCMGAGGTFADKARQDHFIHSTRDGGLTYQLSELFSTQTCDVFNAANRQPALHFERADLGFMLGERLVQGVSQGWELTSWRPGQGWQPVPSLALRGGGWRFAATYEAGRRVLSLVSLQQSEPAHLSLDLGARWQLISAVSGWPQADPLVDRQPFVAPSGVRGEYRRCLVGGCSTGQPGHVLVLALADGTPLSVPFQGAELVAFARDADQLWVFGFSTDAAGARSLRLWQSSDAGRRWVERGVDGGPVSGRPTSAVLSQGVGWLLYDGRLLRRTVDGAATWTNLNLPVAWPTTALTVRGVEPLSFDNRPALVVQGDAGEAMVSGDAGVTWSTLEAHSMGSRWTKIGSTAWNRAAFEDPLVVSVPRLHGRRFPLQGTPISGRLWTGGVFYRTNADARWRATRGKTVTDPQCASVSEALDGTLVLFDSASVSTSRDGGKTWTIRPHQAGCLQAGVSFVSLVEGWAARWPGEVVRSSDGGLTWQTVATSPNMLFEWIKRLPGGALVALAGGDVLRSRDDGRTWQRLAIPMALGVAAVDFHGDRLGWAVGARGQVFHTKDGGDSWVQQYTGVLDTHFTGVAALGPDTVYVSDAFGVVLQTTTGGEGGPSVVASSRLVGPARDRAARAAASGRASNNGP